MFSFDEVKNADAEIYAAMADEMGRQRSHLELIASENLVSKGVMAAMGSHLTNKYAEGYPGKRYYGGCEYVDVVEQLAIDRAKELFGCTYANVQPHSGAQANLAVFFALVKPGDTVMGMSLDAGGHLTHGSKVNISGTYFNIVSYGVNEGLLDKATFMPAIEKGWKALVKAVEKNGKLGYVQPIGADPKKVTREMTEVYGVGAFLLAGNQIYKMAK